MIGGTSYANSAFAVDESSASVLIGGDNTANASIRMEAMDSDVVDIQFNTQDQLLLVGVTSFAIDHESGTSGGEIRLQEGSNNGASYVGFAAPGALSGNQIWTLPTADGGSGECLQTNGSGVLSFGACGGSSLFTDGGTATYLTSVTDDFVIGGSTLAASIFSIDESLGVFLFGGDQSADPTLRFEATDSDTADFGFNTNDSFFFTGGNVGIGTTNPFSQFELFSSTVNPIFSITGAHNTDYDPQIQFRTDGTPTVKFSVGVDANDDEFKIYSGTGIGDTDEFTMDASGLVSIANLQVGSQVFATDAGIVSWLDLPISGGPTAGTVQSYSAAIDGTNILTVYGEADGSGGVQNPRLGIHNTSPGTALSVSGLTGTSSYTTVRVNTSTGDFYYDSSSARYKDNIHDFNTNFSDILQFTTQEYTDLTSGQEEIGLIAEELDQAGLNHLVVYRDGVPDGIKYDRIPLYLLEVLKDHETRIVSLGGGVSSSQSSDLSSLSSQVTLLDEQVTALVDFYDDLQLGGIPRIVNNTFSLDGVQVVVGDLQADAVSANTVVAGAYSVKNVENAPTVGTAVIPSGDRDVFVETELAHREAQVFVTPVGNPVSLSVSSVDDGNGFVVSVGDDVSGDVRFSWFIVGVDVD